MRKDKRWMQIRYNMGVCQNYPVSALDAGSHKSQSYKHLIDKACSSAAPRQARGQGDFAPSPSLSLG